MATLRKRGTRYHVQIRKLGYPSRAQSFSTLKEAQVWARNVESCMDRGIYQDSTPAARTLLTEALNRYLDEVSPGLRSTKSDISRGKVLVNRL